MGRGGLLRIRERRRLVRDGDRLGLLRLLVQLWHRMVGLEWQVWLGLLRLRVMFLLVEWLRHRSGCLFLHRLHRRLGLRQGGRVRWGCRGS